MSDENVWLEKEPTFPKEGDNYNCRIDTGKMKGATCPECSDVHDAWTGLGENPNEVVMPSPGSIIICSSCGSINELTEDHQLVKTDIEELGKSLAEAGPMAQQFFEVLMKAVHLECARKDLEALRESYRRWCNNGDAAFVKEEFGLDVPSDAKVAILTEGELLRIHAYMVANGLDHVGKLTKAGIEKMFADAGSSALQQE